MGVKGWWLIGECGFIAVALIYDITFDVYVFGGGCRSLLGSYI